MRFGARRSGLHWGTKQICLSALLAVLCGGPAWAGEYYTLDQKYGRIAFSVRNFGLFSSAGEFGRFDAKLQLDGGHPERTTIDVAVDAGSVTMPWEQGVEMLRSPDYFDVGHYADIRFQSTSVEVEGKDRYAIVGLLRIRGVTKPLRLEARLIGRHPDPTMHKDVADFVATGVIDRSAFGMTADRVMISDRVDLTINARLQLGQTFDGQ